MTYTRNTRGADDEHGQTPFEVLLLSSSQTPRDIELYISSGGSINHFNSSNDRGCIATMMLIRETPATLIIDAADIMRVDGFGRTAIHNVVSFGPSITGGANFVEMHYSSLRMTIELLLKMGVGVDCQDQSGKTALHYAVHFHNERTVSLLLKAGANVNVVDRDGKSALAASLDHVMWEMPIRQEKQNKGVIKILMAHLRDLKLSGGFCISEHNERMLSKACKLYGKKDAKILRLSSQLKIWKNI